MRWLMGTLAAAALGFLLLAGPERAAAQGTEFNLSCDEGEVLVGIRGRQGWWMDGIGPRCRDLQSNGALAGSAHNHGYAGGSGGTPRNVDCAANEVMVGFSGSQGDNGYVLHVHEVICAPWQAGTRTAGTPTRTLRAFDKKGGSGHWIAESCFQGRIGTRLRGRAGMYLDRLTDMGCSYAQGATQPVVQRPRPVPPPPQQITTAPSPIGPSGSYNTAYCPEPDNPPFSWERVRDASAYVVEFRNDTHNRTETKRVSGTTANPPGKLREGNRYRWRVRATNSLGDGPWSPYLGFVGVEGGSSRPCYIARMVPYF